MILNETVASRIIDDKSLLSTSPFIIHAKNGVVARCGGVSLDCGVLQTKTGCGAIRDEEAKILHKKCYQTPGSSEKSSSCLSFPSYIKVFIVSFKYDCAIGHFMTEVLPRIVYHIEILKDPEVYIHFGCDNKFKRFSPPMQFLEVILIKNCIILNSIII